MTDERAARNGGPRPLGLGRFCALALALVAWTSLATAQASVAPEVRMRLGEAARDRRPEPWQRGFMMEMARNGQTGAARGDRAKPGRSISSRSAASADGSWDQEKLWPSEGAAIYDPVRDRMLVFEGSSTDVWELSLAGNPSWTRLTPAGTPPSERSGQTAIYDPVRDRMVVFGGYYYDGADNLLHDVWALSLAGIPTWTQLTPVGAAPGGRWGHTAIYDPVRDRMVVFGGNSEGVA